MGVAPGQHDVGQRRLFGFQERHDLGDIDIVIADRDVDLVQQHHPVGRITDQLLCLGPSGLGHFGVAGLVLGFPGKPLAHRVKRALCAELAQNQVSFTRRHAAFDELHHSAGQPVGDAAKDHPECGRRLALALAGMDDDQPLLVGLGRHDLVACGLFLGHLDGVTVNVVGGVFGHGVSFGPACSPRLCAGRRGVASI